MFLAIRGLEDYMLPCFNKKLFGFDCMGCGLQRSIVLMLKGQFIDSFLMYPALYPMICFFVFLIFNSFIKIKYNEKIKLVLAGLILLTAIISYIIKMFIH
jgi:hypothetical protein